MEEAGNVSVTSLRFRPLQQADALAMMSWRYPPPYSAYDLKSGDAAVLAALLRQENNYHAILISDELTGFFCRGVDARVPGWRYDESALDLGMGLRPDLTGRGQGQVFLQAVLARLEQQIPGAAVRATILAWNERAIRMCRRAGFRQTANFIAQRKDRQECVVLVREPA